MKETLIDESKFISQKVSNEASDEIKINDPKTNQNTEPKEIDLWFYLKLIFKWFYAITLVVANIFLFLALVVYMFGKWLNQKK